MERYINESLHIVGPNQKCNLILGEKLRTGTWQIALHSVSLKLKDASAAIAISVSTNLCGQVEVDEYGDLKAIDTTLFQFTTQKNVITQAFYNPLIVWLDITETEKKLNLNFTESFTKSTLPGDSFQVSVLIMMRRIR